VAFRLEQQGLVSNAVLFKIFARVSGKTSLRVGEYALSSTMYPAEVLDTVISGRSVEHSITFQEGLNKFEMAEIFAARGLGSARSFLQAVDDPALIRSLLGENQPSLEGYLFPETYKVTRYTGARGLIKKMVDNFLRVYDGVKSAQTVNMNRHQLVTLASIIEKETGAPEERRRISSVYHNRLKKPMRLQADPTVLYGIWMQTGNYKNNLTKRDLKTKTPYNTYTNNGLPVGPIANAGKEALLAAADPEHSEYLYFVSRNNGTHVFSTDYKAHVNAVRKFQLDRRARANKSWRDLSTREKENNVDAAN
jgi:UPF0755 protein